jgi:hypothetical protein
MNEMDLFFYTFWGLLILIGLLHWLAVRERRNGVKK